MTRERWPPEPDQTGWLGRIGKNLPIVISVVALVLSAASFELGRRNAAATRQINVNAKLAEAFDLIGGEPGSTSFTVEPTGETPVLELANRLIEEGMSRALLKLSGSLVHDYATISDDSPSPNRASRARRAATSAGIS